MQVSVYHNLCHPDCVETGYEAEHPLQKVIGYDTDEIDPQIAAKQAARMFSTGFDSLVGFELRMNRTYMHNKLRRFEYGDVVVVETPERSRAYSYSGGLGMQPIAVPPNHERIYR